MQYIKKAEFAQLKGKNIKITKVYGPYRYGYNPTTKRYEKVKKGSEHITIWKDGVEVEVDGKVDYKIHKPKYDIVIELDEEAKINAVKWNKAISENEDVVLEDTEFTVQKITATMFGDMLACGVAFGKVPKTEDWKRQFDWEQEFVESCVGAVIKFSTNKEDYSFTNSNGELKEGTYDAFTFKEVSSPEVEDVEDDWLPF